MPPTTQEIHNWFAETDAMPNLASLYEWLREMEAISLAAANTYSVMAAAIERGAALEPAMRVGGAVRVS